MSLRIAKFDDKGKCFWSEFSSLGWTGGRRTGSFVSENGFGTFSSVVNSVESVLIIVLVDVLVEVVVEVVVDVLVDVAVGVTCLVLGGLILGLASIRWSRARPMTPGTIDESPIREVSATIWGFHVSFSSAKIPVNTSTKQTVTIKPNSIKWKGFGIWEGFSNWKGLRLCYPIKNRVQRINLKTRLRQTFRKRIFFRWFIFSWFFIFISTHRIFYFLWIFLTVSSKTL